MKIERIFQAVAVIFSAATVYFFWNGSTDAAFGAGVLGACSFLLSIRFQIKARNVLREAREKDERK
ncbi:MAG: hypothetical protein ACR2IH_04490 [Pyrinomonadaceae bacterium]